MAAIVEHKKRKRFILEKSMKLFCKAGYESVSLQKIAKECGITRTTLYMYFKNKRDIFVFCIKVLTENLESEIRKILEDQNLTARQALQKIAEKILSACEENRLLFKVLLPYLISLEKTGVNIQRRVRRRIVRVQHFLSLILIRGIKNGEFNFSVKDANEILYESILSAIFKIAILNQKSISEVKESTKNLIEKM